MKVRRSPVLFRSAMIMYAEARQPSQERAGTGPGRGTGRVYHAARLTAGLGTVMEDGWALNPVRADAARHFPHWRFDWGPSSTPAGRDWLAWALHERLGFDR